MRLPLFALGLLCGAILAFAVLDWLGIPPRAKAGALTHVFVGSVAWSPDGKEIAWQERLNGDAATMWTASANGSDMRLVGRYAQGGGEMEWLPGNRLLWDGNFELLSATVGAASARAQQVSDTTFSTDRSGNLVAWGTASCPLCRGPVVVESLHDGARRSFGGSDSKNVLPTLSPDGRRVLFSRFRCAAGGGECDQDDGLWIASVESGRLHHLPDLGTCPLWSPDGSSILIQRGEYLATMTPSGGSLTPLVRDHGCNTDPGNFAWSPNSKSVAFWDSAERFGGLSIVNVNTKRVRRVTGARTGQILRFAWSPDSTKLLISARPTYNACASLWLVRADGSGNTLLRNCN